jgi:diacylglycerol kinase
MDNLRKAFTEKMMDLVVIALAVFVRMSEAGVPLPRKVVLNGDNLEILRLDIMTAEVRVSNNVKVMADRVEDALARHGAKLDEVRADLQRSNIAAAAAFDRQATRMDLVEAILSQLVNATMFQIDIRPLISGIESVVRNAGLEAKSAAGAAKEAAAAANETRTAVKAAVAAAPSTKAEPAPGWDEWEYWWGRWQATWYTPLSLFFLGFALYEADRKAHVIGFFLLGAFFQPYIAGVALVLVCIRKSTACGRKTRRWIQLTPCGRYFCPRAAAELRREEVLASMAMGRTPSRRARARSLLVNSTMYESALDEADPPPSGFWAYARSWLNPFSRYRPLGAHNSFIVWYV